MSCKQNKIDHEQAAKTLQNNSRLTTSRIKTSNKRNNEQLMEEDSNKINIGYFCKITRSALLKSNFAAYSCIIVYIIICLLGNVVTGVIVYKHLGLQSPSWKSLFQTELPMDEKLTKPELDYDTEYVEKSDINVQFFDLNKTENEVSQFKKFQILSKFSIVIQTSYDCILLSENM